MAQKRSVMKNPMHNAPGNQKHDRKLTHLSRIVCGMELAPSQETGVVQGVAKASQGHDPLPFWISVVKNYRKDIIEYFISPNYFFRAFSLPSKRREYSL